MEAYEKGLYKPMTCKSFGYAVFGRVIKGMDVVTAIEKVKTGNLKGHQNVPVEPVIINSIVRLQDVTNGEVSDNR